MRRGEIYLVDLSNSIGSEQIGVRPAVIVQNERGNRYSPTTIICPMTSRQKTVLETHITLSPSECGVLRDSTVLCEQVRVIDKSRIIKKVGEISSSKIMSDIDKRLMTSLGLSKSINFWG